MKDLTKITTEKSEIWEANVLVKTERDTYPALTQEEMVQAYNDNEEVIGFIGGVEVEAATLDEVHSVVTVDDGEVSKTYRESCLHVLSLDGTMAVIRICSRVGNAAYTYSTNEEFRRFADKFGVENLIRKSETQLLVSSDKYTKPQEDII